MSLSKDAATTPKVDRAVTSTHSPVEEPVVAAVKRAQQTVRRHFEADTLRDALTQAE
ncbi:hypothetical protein RYH80_17850 [Halobaculum sp. MBLA0147]|uniref:hypothetical protein n=1 Tax=Halobaculum sp. MBLA0147 TaxID=3079934 RepID=UPI003525A86F